MHVVVRKWLRVMYEGVWCQSPEARPTIPNQPRGTSKLAFKTKSYKTLHEIPLLP